MKRYLDLDALENYLKERERKTPGIKSEVRHIECWEGPDIEACKEIFGEDNWSYAFDNILKKNGAGYFCLSLDNFIVYEE